MEIRITNSMQADPPEPMVITRMEVIDEDQEEMRFEELAEIQKMAYEEGVDLETFREVIREYTM